MKQLGQYYQSRIDNYAVLLAEQTIQFEQGTTDGLNKNYAYDYLSAGNGSTFYIKIPDTFIPIAGEIMIPVIIPAKYHFKVETTGNKQVITKISATEFDAIEGSLQDNGDHVYVLNQNTITCACDAVAHDQYVANLKQHQNLLSASVAEGQVLSADFLNHLNNTIEELQSVRELIARQAQSYSSTAEQLTTLAEQTLATADHDFQIAHTLENVADAYGDMLSDDEYITYWRAIDVDASGRISAEVYGNGIVNDYAYNQGTGQLQAIHSGLLSFNPVRHLEYQYDEYQNVTLRDDLVNDIREQFTYDRMDRLSSTQVSSGKYAVDDLNQVQTLNYDSLGNITYKSDVGDYVYGEGAAGPHAVTHAGDNAYSYDANGNMVSGNGRTIQWSTDNKPTVIRQNGRSVTFNYGPDRARYKKVNHSGDVTLYIGGLYEQLIQGADKEEKLYIYAAGQLVAEQIVSNKKDVQTRYLHKDALGSVDLVTDAYGNVVDRRSFDPWGKLRTFPWNAEAILEDPLYVTQLPFTNKGFTGHEQVQEVDLIHMNGRMYDATLARFISADPHIQADGLSQSYNRYSYVMNNPMKYTDPSGYFWNKLGHAIVGAWEAIKPYAGIIVTGIVMVGAMAVCGPGCAYMASMIGSVAGGATQAAVDGQGIGGIVRAGILGGIQAAVYGGIGVRFSGIFAIAAHGFAGGTFAVMQGGDFGQGFMSAAFSKAVTLGLNARGTYMDDRNPAAIAARTTVAAVVGGTTSVIGGGKFENGARTAAMAHLLNGEATEGAQKGDGFFKGLWKKATGWHFEGRDARNGNLPTYEQATGQGSEWTLLSPEQSIFHDNGVGKPELKFIHPDGREAVFNGDTLSLVTDSKYVGTYNYVNPAPVPDRWYDVGGWGAYAGKGLGHLVLDVVPYAAGGNVRGEN